MSIMSVNRGNVGSGAPARDNGAMPVMAGDDPCRDGESSLPGRQDPARAPLRELMDDRLLDALLDRSRDQAGGLRLTGEGSMLGELVRAVLERAGQSWFSAVRMPACACLPSRSKAGLSSGARRRDGPLKVNSAV
jgi:hypothetical protein